jgi:hypothetical protein
MPCADFHEIRELSAASCGDLLCRISRLLEQWEVQTELHVCP